ncbi:MAG: rod shape-determining protein MreC, partial [Acidobacteriota bacterium]
MTLLSLQLPRGQKPSYLERTFFSFLSPLQKGVNSFFWSVSQLWEGYIHLRDVKKENEDLKKEIFKLKEENVLLRQSLKEYENVAKMRSLLKMIEEDILSARVIGLDPSNYFKSITINRGRKDGIQENMAVLDPRGFLVGRT